MIFFIWVLRSKLRPLCLYMECLFYWNNVQFLSGLLLLKDLVCMYVLPAQLYTMYMQCPRGPVEGTEFPWTGVNSCEIPCGYQKSNQGPLENQPLLLTPGLPFRAQKDFKTQLFNFKCLCLSVNRYLQRQKDIRPLDLELNCE